MRHAFKSVLAISTLLLGAAQATSGSMGGNTSISSSTRVEVRGAVLLDAQGRTVGTFMNNGQAMASGALQTATQVRVTFEGGTSKTYSLAGNIGAQARVSLDTLVVRSGNGTALMGQAIRADLRAMQQNTQVVSGKTVTLVSASGSVVGTFMADGTLRASGDLREATGAVVTLGNGQRLSYDLATRLMADASGTLGLGEVKVRDQGRSVALVSVLTTLRQDGKVTTGGANSNGNTSVGGSASASGQVDASTSGGSSSGGISIGVGSGISIGGGK